MITTRQMFDADFAAIEARITCWVAREEGALAEYYAQDAATTKEEKQRLDRYRIMATDIFGVPIDEVNKHPQRFVGKQAILGCIAEGELVLTDCGLVPIQKVCAWHRVWDGVEWVNHDGVIFKGFKEVIQHDGVTATPCHEVFIYDRFGFQRTTDLRSAKSQQQRIIVSGKGRTPVRALDFAFAPSLQEQQISLRQSEVCVRNNSVSEPHYTNERNKFGVRQLRTIGHENTTLAKVVDKTDGICKRQMHKPALQSLQMVWDARDRVSFQITDPCSKLDNGQLGFEEAFGVRPRKQRWALRTGEFKIHRQIRATLKFNSGETRFGFCSNGMALLRVHSEEVSETWNDSAANRFTSGESSIGKTEGMEKDSTKVVATYDILNAGPRHRFTVSDKLVHNCGFGAAAPKFRTMCWTMGKYKLPPGLEFTVVDKFRAKHRRIKASWYEVDTAAKNAIVRKGEVFEAARCMFMVKETGGIPYLLIRLPSGRKLAYPKPRVQPSKKFPAPATEIVYFGQIGQSRQWGDVDTYGGKLLENLVQGIAADIMAIGSHNAEDNGFPIITLIHDQALGAFNGRAPSEFVGHLTNMPAWAEGLPIEAEGGLVDFYTKD